MQFSTQISQWIKFPYITSGQPDHTQHISVSRYVIKALCIIALSCFVTTVNSQETSYQTPVTSVLTNETLQYEKTFDKGKYYYQQKRYNDAITQYTQSLKYLLGDDKATQKNIGITYTKIAESYKRLKVRDKTAYFYKKALDIFTNLDNRKYMARTLNTLAEAERYLGNLVIALNRSTQSLEIHKTINDPKGYAKALMGAGIIYRHIGRYEKSIDHIHKAYSYYKKINDYNGISKSANEIGYLYIRLEQFEQAKYFFQETINSPEEEIKLSTFSSALREMAIIYLNQGDFDSAMIVAKKAFKIYQKENEKLKESLTARIIANIYRAQQDNINAIDYYKKSLSIAIEKGNKSYQIKAQTPLAAILIVQDTNEAIRLLIDSLEIAIKTKDANHTLYTYRTLRQAEDYRGNFKKALSYAKKEIALAKIIQTELDNKNFTLTKATLHSHKMEIEIESLKEKTRLDQLELTRKNNEIEIVDQARKINELSSIKNKFANLALGFLLIICIFIIIFIYRQFIVSKNHNKELDYLASRDPLTNCYNRRSLFRLMNSYFTSYELDIEYCVIMADIDHFKNVNDTYGHATGDSVIRGFSSILQSCVRQKDIVARFGGEEFCVILHHVSQHQAMNIAEAMRDKVEKSIFDDVKVTSSFGVTSLQFNATTPSDLIEQADLALYKSKSNGRNQVTLWNECLK